MENSTLNDFFEKVITVKWGPEKKSVDIIDQTLLPGEVRRIQLKNLEEMVEAIKKLRVRGAPAIGVCAAYSMAVLAQRMPEQDFETFYKEFLCAEEELAASRPTAVNLFWALHRMDEVCNANRERQVVEIKRLLLAEAEAIREEDVQISRNIGEIGFQLLEERKQEGEELGILTHCNAGTLATAKYGTATAPMYIALEHGWQIGRAHV